MEYIAYLPVRRKMWYISVFTHILPHKGTKLFRREQYMGRNEYPAVIPACRQVRNRGVFADNHFLFYSLGGTYPCTSFCRRGMIFPLW